MTEVVNNSAEVKGDVGIHIANGESVVIESTHTVVSDAEGNVVIRQKGPLRVCPSDPADDTQCESCQ